MIGCLFRGLADAEAERPFDIFKEKKEEERGKRSESFSSRDCYVAIR